MVKSVMIMVMMMVAIEESPVITISQLRKARLAPTDTAADSTAGRQAAARGADATEAATAFTLEGPAATTAATAGGAAAANEGAAATTAATAGGAAATTGEAAAATTGEAAAATTGEAAAATTTAVGGAAATTHEVAAAATAPTAATMAATAAATATLRGRRCQTAESDDASKCQGCCSDHGSSPPQTALLPTLMKAVGLDLS
jgi:hypothetical protein